MLRGNLGPRPPPVPPRPIGAVTARDVRHMTHTGGIGCHFEKEGAGEAERIVRYGRGLILGPGKSHLELIVSCPLKISGHVICLQTKETTVRFSLALTNCCHFCPHRDRGLQLCDNAIDRVHPRAPKHQ